MNMMFRNPDGEEPLPENGRRGLFGLGRGGRSRRSERDALAALLDFQSPTAALLEEPVPLFSRATVWLITGLVLTSIGVMAICPVDRVVTVTGRVTAQNGNLRIQPLDVSIIRSIDVREGQLVKAGDRLARLDPTIAQADSANQSAQVESLSAETQRLRAELDDAPYRAADHLSGQIQAAIHAQRQAERAAHEARYEAKLLGAEAQVRQARGDVDGYGERLDIALQIEEKRRRLEELKVGSQMELLKATDGRLEMARGRDSATSALESARRSLAALAAERDGFFRQTRSETAQRLAETERRLSEARELMNKAQRRSQLVELHAAQDAVVLKVATLSPGSVVQSGEELISLVPLDAVLEVDVTVPGHDAGFVHAGAGATIKFDTFDDRTYGHATGTVRLVSADSFRQQDQSAPRAAQGRTGPDGLVSYNGRIALDEVKLRGLPPGFRIVPGMPVTADIKAGERTILSYLLSNSVPLFTNGMREP